MKIEVKRKFCLLFHLPCLCADFQGYFTIKLLFFFASAPSFYVLFVLQYFCIYCGFSPTTLMDLEI